MSEHRWVVDGIEEEHARIEIDGGAVRTVPLWLLPPGVREGEVLRVTHTRARGRSELLVEIDAEAREAERERSTAQVRELKRESKRKDRGGDVAL